MCLPDLKSAQDSNNNANIVPSFKNIKNIFNLLFLLTKIFAVVFRYLSIKLKTTEHYLFIYIFIKIDKK